MLAVPWGRLRARRVCVGMLGLRRLGIRILVKFYLNVSIHMYTYVPIYTYVHVSLGIIQIHAFVASFGSRRRHALRYRTSSLTCIVRTTIFGYTMIWRWSTIRAAAYVPEKDLCDIGV